jgi:serine/threonine-protein kinase
MGTVWRAHDEVLQRPVAVKLLHDTLAVDERAAERFRREALTAASVAHPNMANVFDYIQEDDRPGIVMELVEGETLAHAIARDGAMPADRAVAVAASVLDALEAAHSAGIVHRDVKPANVLLTSNGGIKVADFGIARALSEASLTQTGTVMGTAHYSAPEQVRGEPASPATDVYSAGVMLYEMLTGARPFAGDTPVAVAMARLSEDPPSPRAQRPDIPPHVDAIVMRALARNPADRFPSAKAMREALDGIAAPNGASSPSGRTGALALDHTQALVLSSSDPTIALSTDGAVVVAREGEAHHEKPVPLADAVPPRWAGKRLLLWLLPLFMVALLAAGLFALLSKPSTVALPNFANATLEQARAMAARSGIEIAPKVLTRDSAKPKGTVLRQSIPAGTVVQEGSSIQLTVSSGTPPCCTVPDLTGKTPAEAKEALERAHLELGRTINRVTTEGEPGRVIDQNPRAGISIDPGDPVDIVVRTAEENKDDDRRGRRKGKGD